MLCSLKGFATKKGHSEAIEQHDTADQKPKAPQTVCGFEKEKLQTLFLKQQQPNKQPTNQTKKRRRGWGWGDRGQLGSDNATQRRASSAVPVEVEGIEEMTVALGLERGVLGVCLFDVFC